MNYLLLSLSLLLSSCAGTGSGILAQFDSAKPLDPGQIDRHCDLEDAAACLLAGKHLDQPITRIPIVQGVAPPGRAVFAALLEQTIKVRWYLREEGALRLEPLAITQSTTRPHSAFRVDQIRADQLKPEITYELIGVNSLGQLVDQRLFQTLPSQTPSLRFALISATDDHSTQFDLWRDLIEQRPQIIFGLGNNVYANSRGAEFLGPALTPNLLWDRYVETRQKLPIFQERRLIPIITTWNDRDYGMLNGNLTYPYADESRQTMEAFFPIQADAKNILEGPGIARALKIAGQTFLLFDNRTYRSPADATEKTYLGRMQEDWAATVLSGSENTNWMMLGEKWFGKNSFESSEPGSFVNFLSELSLPKKNGKSKKIGKLIFASGVQSDTGFQRVSSQRTYEFNSGFQNPVHPSISRKTAQLNGGYLLLESELRKSELQIKAQIRAANKTFYDETIRIKLPASRKR